MKTTEIFMIFFAIVGIGFITAHLPGGDLFTLLGFTVLATLYMFLGFAFFNGISFRKAFSGSSYKEISQSDILIGIFTGVFLGPALMGIMFKILGFPGAHLLMISGLPAIVLLAFLLFFRNRKHKSPINMIAFRRLAIIGALSIILLSIPLRIWYSWKYAGYPALIEAKLKLEEDPTNPEYKRQFDEEMDRIINDRNDVMDLPEEETQTK